MEPHAKANYLSVTEKNHRKLVSSEAGSIIMPEKPFIAVSPDLLIDCLCCGQGVTKFLCSQKEVLGSGKCSVSYDTDFKVSLNLF